MNGFLPVSLFDMQSRGWEYCDWLLVTGDAYVDHPSFGAAVIGRVLESENQRVCILAQPQGAEDFYVRPRRGVMITGGNIDSMVAHYTAAKRRRSEDAYSPDNRVGLRPDRAVIAYTKLAREKFGDIFVVLGGLEASLRRFAHYDYWDDRVLPSVLISSGADCLVYGMGERAVIDLARGVDFQTIKGVCHVSDAPIEGKTCHSFEEVSGSRRKYAQSFMLQYGEHDPVRGAALVQRHGDRFLIQNPPAMPPGGAELDRYAALPYTRAAHPMYKNGIKAVEEVRFSVIHNRGCFGACNFCSIAFHQGRIVTARSEDSVVAEVKTLAALPDFKGIINDVGGPTANWTAPACADQLKRGVCRRRNCLAPEPCPRADLDGGRYLKLLRRLRGIDGVKRVFVRSGLRYDALLRDKSGLLNELVKYHVSGQLKVAPEHCQSSVLDYMGKPHWEVFERFEREFARLNKKHGLKQYLVPYLISSHPGCTLRDAVELAVTLKRSGRRPEQVQDFYPTPGTLSTCMYYTGIDPRDMKPVSVPRSPSEKALQRALLQWFLPQNKKLVIEALKRVGRTDLIGDGKDCLVRGEVRRGAKPKNRADRDERRR